MIKQRICIIGDGLSGLMTAAVLAKVPGIEVNLIAKKGTKNVDKRTTAISDTNYKFINQNITSLGQKLFWPSKKIELFYETSKESINFLNLNEANSNLMYVFENNKVKSMLLKEISKNKIKLIRKDLKNLDELKNYDLIILCIGGQSKIYDNLTKNRSIKKDYKEIAITGYVKHNFKTLNTSQFFLKEGPLAILPFSKSYFSFVWSVNKSFFENNSKKITTLVKNKIDEILKSKQEIIISNIQSYPIFLNLRRQYHQKNILILGEGLHTIHPVAGQGFNLVLRDIKKLNEIIKYYVGLGISLKNSYALNDFYNSRKPENTIMSLGVDATHSFFKENKYLNPFKKLIVKNIKNNETLIKFSKIISNRGLSL
ncbi:MAG: FAD-dependent monooxygenase [Pseudomonadota bacterium]|nr:FAD-dependent monooxygenase [Pseudomonadota bacterium]